MELIGGGTRIPFVRNAVLDIVGADKLSQTLDSNSTVALGASTLAPGEPRRLAGLACACVCRLVAAPWCARAAPFFAWQATQGPVNDILYHAPLIRA